MNKWLLMIFYSSVHLHAWVTTLTKGCVYLPGSSQSRPCSASCTLRLCWPLVVQYQGTILSNWQLDKQNEMAVVELWMVWAEMGGRRSAGFWGQWVSDFTPSPLTAPLVPQPLTHNSIICTDCWGNYLIWIKSVCVRMGGGDSPHTHSHPWPWLELKKHLFPPTN